MITDSIKVTGDLCVTLFDSSGAIKDKREVKNLVVTAGKSYIASRMSSNSTVVMSHMAVGSSNTAPSASNTGLGAELGRVVLDTMSTSGATVTHVATFPAGTGTGALNEAGIFNASANGTMLCRTIFNTVNKASGDTVVISWNVTVS